MPSSLLIDIAPPSSLASDVCKLSPSVPNDDVDTIDNSATAKEDTSSPESEVDDTIDNTVAIKGDASESDDQGEKQGRASEAEIENAFTEIPEKGVIVNVDNDTHVIVGGSQTVEEDSASVAMESDVIVVDDGNNRVDDISKRFTQKQLRNLLKTNNIISNGSKRDLINRILEHGIELD